MTNKMPEKDSQILKDARETFTYIYEISNLLKTGLDPDVLMCCIRLCEEGIPPEILSWVISELKRETSILMEQKTKSEENKNLQHGDRN
ncbi:mitotic-spindle organizing protein 1-like [Chrysoperla carnea]|uniref:mitotic-spindle organizing protein 1-like n=1 Tax=Chrysoperla carnea TaxID=189513 RepID=UPI001D06157C|nr:mitotic-spindle organizing protein 1-like [Chrysoperla carnea]XP_044727400.1 mitotic-spindle organizing protein 1-like [Chrysoperla carnea]